MKRVTVLSLSLSLSLLLSIGALPRAVLADALDDARRLAVADRHAEAREAARRILRRRPGEPEALQIVVASSCSMGDRVTARLAYKRLPPDVRAIAARHCSRRGVGLEREAAPTNPRLAAAPATGEAGPDPRRPWRIAAWTTVAAMTAVVISVSVLTGKITALESELEAEVLSYRKATGDHTFGSSDACSEASGGGPATAGLAGLCADGGRYATVNNVLLGVTAALAAAGGYFLYRGYLRRERQPGVSLSAGVTGRAGGMSLCVSF